MKRFVLLVCLMFAPAAHAQSVSAAVPQSKAEITLSFAPLVKQVAPAVVNIYTQRMVRQRLSPLFDDPFLRQFFGDALPQGMSRDRIEKSLGSGVIVKADGLIVTSRHVIDGADQIRVVLADRREFDAKVILSDEHADLAVLRIAAKGENFPFLELKDSDEAQVGDLVLALGNPFGVGQTVTSGIVSALARHSGGSGFDYYIQTDAAINPGNSGGALVTMDGRLVGINASIYSRDGGNMGIGFAVPSNLVRLLLSATAQGKSSVTHPWLGIGAQEVTQDIAASLGMASPHGFLVKKLNPVSPAAKAGLRVGDVVVAVNGHDIDDSEAFTYRIATLALGSNAQIGIMRQGQKSELTVAMIAAPEDPPRATATVTGQNPVAGATLVNLSPAVAEEMGLADDGQGAVVSAVKDGSLAARIGLQTGDVVAVVNGNKIANVSDAVAALKQSGNGWRLTIRRGGEDISLMLGR